MKKIAMCLLVLLTLGAVGHMVHYYPQLPDTVASHFGPGGEPDGWSSKGSLITLYAVMIAVLGGMFLGLAVFLPKLPTSLVNMPNRDYWLAPERRQESLATMNTVLLWLGSATLAFMIAVMHLTFLVNLGQRPGLGATFWWLMGIYAFVTIATTVWMWVRFKKVPAIPG